MSFFILSFFILGVHSASLNVSWTSPSVGDVFGPGDVILGKWSATPAVVQPSFRLCMGTEGDCGTVVWPTVDFVAGVYSISLAVPNVTALEGYYLEMKTTDGDALSASSPTFSLSPTAVVHNTTASSTSSVPSSTSSAAPFLATTTRARPPVAAFAVPLSIVGAIVLVAGLLALRHRRALAKERLLDAARIIAAQNAPPLEKAGDVEKAFAVGAMPRRVTRHAYRDDDGYTRRSSREYDRLSRSSTRSSRYSFYSTSSRGRRSPSRQQPVQVVYAQPAPQPQVVYAQPPQQFVYAEQQHQQQQQFVYPQPTFSAPTFASTNTLPTFNSAMNMPTFASTTALPTFASTTNLPTFASTTANAIPPTESYISRLSVPTSESNSFLPSLPIPRPPSSFGSGLPSSLMPSAGVSLMPSAGGTGTATGGNVGVGAGTGLAPPPRLHVRSEAEDCYEAIARAVREG